MDEIDKSIRKMTEAVQIEKNARLHDKMKAVLGVRGYTTSVVAHFADVDESIVLGADPSRMRQVKT